MSVAQLSLLGGAVFMLTALVTYEFQTSAWTSQLPKTISQPRVHTAPAFLGKALPQKNVNLPSPSANQIKALPQHQSQSVDSSTGGHARPALALTAAVAIMLVALKLGLHRLWQTTSEIPSQTYALMATSGETAVNPPPEVMADLVEFLKEDLKHLFDDKGIDASKYDKNVKFQDPITQYDDLDGYLRNIQFLRLAFRPTFQLHSCQQTGPREITTRWTMGMKAWILPWQPELLFTGRTYMTVSPTTLKFDSHRDEWDSVQNNAYLSLEAVQDLMRQVFQVYATPDLKSPEYEVLRRTANYEIRKYKSYIIAETPMGSGAGIASGSGFNTLAGYIFGNNAAKEKMNMTTPVYTTAPAAAGEKPTMQFVMEAAAPDQLPAPNTSDVRVKEVNSQLVAAVKFGGIATDGQVEAEERKLRSILAKDGVPVEPGYMCARYNEPTAPPFVRRNEVLIRIKDGYDALKD